MHATSCAGLHPPPLSLHLLVDQVPGVWLSPLHTSVMWCNQLVKPVSRFLLAAAQESLLALRNASTQVAAQAQGSPNRSGVVGMQYDHAAIFLRHARQQLTGSYLQPWLRLHPTGNKALGPSSNAPGAPATDQAAESPPAALGVEEALTQVKLGEAQGQAAAGGAGTACAGPNLRWYEQYIQAVQVPLDGASPSQGTCHTSSATSASSEGSEGSEAKSLGSTLVLQGTCEAQQVGLTLGLGECE